MVLCQVDDHGDQHWEGLVFVSLQYVQEVIILKEAHGSISYLEMDPTDALHDPLEEFRDEVFNSIDLTYLQNFLELSQEEGLLDAVGKWPIF